MRLIDKLKAWFGVAPPANDAVPPAPAPPSDVSAAPHPGAAAGSPASTRGTKPRSATDDARTEAEARALFERGEAAEAIALLDARATLLARHEPTTLPCLCKRCLRPEVDHADASGVTYRRDFVVSYHRALFYWVPEELAGEAKHVRASMRSELRSHLHRRATRADEPRRGINPFTKQPIVILPKPRRARVNPFTGKRVP